MSSPMGMRHPRPLESWRCWWAEREHPRERRKRKGATDGPIWYVYVGSSSFGYGHMHVNFWVPAESVSEPESFSDPKAGPDALQLPLPRIKPSTSSLIRNSRGESWHVGYAHSCDPQGARKTVPSAIRRSRYRKNAKRRPRWAGCGECWKYSWCFGTRQTEGKMRRSSPLIAIVWSGKPPRLRWLGWFWWCWWCW